MNIQDKDLERKKNDLKEKEETLRRHYEKKMQQREEVAQKKALAGDMGVIFRVVGKFFATKQGRKASGAQSRADRYH